MGPVCFLLYIGDLGHEVQDVVHILKYVDDSKILGKVKDDEDVNGDERDAMMLIMTRTMYRWRGQR